ncbi:N-acetylmuramoyl-L-alanine amidase [Actinokineospora bangkokensis]|uniref:N-acetylmuramoyl-L-alanine amidase n=1 Tax=Actinokineospora bangkokensis TaxID=1193682 RepID=A0A1Q9LDX8_9PSEU|nr:N-acetylmuramoyl-L-alanine amidase [Actinokineospora bangkokensis]
MRRVALVCSLSAAAALAACGTEVASPPPVAPTTAASTTASQAPVSPPPPPTTTTRATTTAPAPTTTTTTTRPKPVPGKVVVLDPGHNGGNAAHPSEINKKVPAGRGQTKACNTTGTATDAGYAEHAFTWDLAQRVSALLTERGIKVVLTRSSDTGVGPCVNTRAAIGNDSGAAAVVSLHADGSTSAGARGFHVAYSAPPLNAAQGEPSLTLARGVRDALVAGGFPVSTYIGAQGLSPRSDLGGLNLSTRPAVLVECGNMRNAAEASVLSSPAGRQRYAAAIAEGIARFVG